MTDEITRRNFLARCGRCALVCAGAGVAGWPTGRGQAAGMPTLEKGYIGRIRSPYYTSLGDKVVRCDLCPRLCEVAAGDRGHCEVRENVDGVYYSLVYGNPCAIHADPIEKKPFFHVLPGTRSFSLATAGCNMDCKFCQNWEISQALPEETHNYKLTPEDAVALAERYGCRSIASTYVEPTIFIEYMLAIGNRARRAGILNVIHSNGYINPGPLDDLCEVLDAACIDLKGFTEDYYREMTGGRLAPVLETLKRLKAAGVHTELVNLVVPGKNDADKTIRKMCDWIAETLGPDVPLHFSRFHPMYRLKSLPPTPVSTLERSRKTAQAAGLRFVYLGNVPGHPGESTACPGCGRRVIERTGYRIGEMDIQDGACAHCGTSIPGIWSAPAGKM